MALIKDKIKVLLADDHELVLAGIRQLLANEKDIQIVGEASDGDEAVRLFKEKKPDIIVMDIQMPGIGGVEACRRVLQRDPKVKIIILTSSKSEMLPTLLFDMHVQGYISKRAEMIEVLHAIRAVWAGKPYLSPDIAQMVALRKMSPDQEAWTLLSERERQVAMLMAEGIKNKVIADKLSISPKTVNTYRYRVYGKLKIHTDVELILYVLKHQLIELDVLEKGVV